MRGIFTLFLSISVLSLGYTSFATYEYIYPVACLVQNNKKYFYLIHQTSHNHIELLLWNPNTKETQKVLLSRFTPAGLQIIPNSQGFSFIDHDTLQVKMHHKRSPHLIDFEEPLYDVTLISWINEVTFYFSARNNGMFGIYQASLQGHYDCIVASDDYDCLYPQKINNLLFYIERNKEFSHKIVCIPKICLPDQELDPVRYMHYQRKTELVKKEYTTIERRTLLNLDKKSVAFLHMISDSEGFFIEHPSAIEKNDANITFHYHYMHHMSNDTWNDTVLFSFSIPAHYLVHKDQGRLYESMLPLLPRYISGYGFLFVDINDNGTSLGIYFYDNNTQKIICLDMQEHQSLFGICIDDNTIYYGGTVAHDDNMSLPRMWLADNGQLCVDLPVSIHLQI